MRSVHIAGWGYVSICILLIVQSAGSHDVAPAALPIRAGGGGSDAVQWFRRMKPYCNSVEVVLAQQRTPAPRTAEGAGYSAACFALAGRTDDARRVIDGLPAGQRYAAAGIVFDAGHPVADAGDDLAAGPIMELVVDYWPNHYMALYHAGMAEYMLGQFELSKRNLTDFLSIYHENDGWRANATEVLQRLNDPAGIDRSRIRRPREPGR